MTACDCQETCPTDWGGIRIRDRCCEPSEVLTLVARSLDVTDDQIMDAIRAVRALIPERPEAMVWGSKEEIALYSTWLDPIVTAFAQTEHLEIWRVRRALMRTLMEDAMAQKRCVKCDRPIHDPKLPPGERELCYRCGDPS